MGRKEQVMDQIRDKRAVNPSSRAKMVKHLSRSSERWTLHSKTKVIFFPHNPVELQQKACE
jgi:hypothetical protein